MSGDEPRPGGPQASLEDLLRRLTPPAEQLKALQQLLSLVPAAMEQRQALQQLFSQVFLPPERLRGLRELLRTFAPPAEQLEALQRELAAQREQLNGMLRELESMERSVARLAALGDQLRATQDGFVGLMSLFLGSGGTERAEGRGEGPTSADAPGDA